MKNNMKILLKFITVTFKINKSLIFYYVTFFKFEINDYIPKVNKCLKLFIIYLIA